VLELKSNADDVSDNVGDFSKKLESTIETRLGLAGAFLEGKMAEKISGRLSPPLHPYTVEKKGSSQPLVDKGELLSQLDHKVTGNSVEVGVFGSRAGIAKIQEFGKRIDVTPKMRKYLHSQGLHLKSSTTQVIIPERSFMRSSFSESKGKIIKIIGGK
jgi:hypothetical protein